LLCGTGGPGGRCRTRGSTLEALANRSPHGGPRSGSISRRHARALSTRRSRLADRADVVRGDPHRRADRVGIEDGPMIALVSTGGTIAMVGRHPYDWVDYAESKVVRAPDEILAELAPLLPKIPIEIVPVRGIGSTGITFADWRALHDVVSKLVARTEIAGVVITHGTATLEETAWFLAL